MAVTISGDVFRGFFIQARDVATNNWIGNWVESQGSKVHPECSSVTHGDPRDKQQATLVWQAPHDAQPGQVYFTFVFNYSMNANELIIIFFSFTGALY